MQENKEPLSRRDFLRRAGKEAVDTGTKLVPGGNLARQALNIEPKKAEAWWQRLVHWRKQQTEQEKTEENDSGTND